MNISTIPVSYYRNIGDTLGLPVPLHTLLTRLRPEHIELIDQLRATTSPDEKHALKKKLPLFAPSSLLRNRVANTPMDQKLISYSGFMQFDIDQKDNPGMEAEKVRDIIAYIPFVAYVSLSVSGQGVWGLVRVASPENLDKHFAHFRSMVESRTKIKLDPTKGSNPTGLRYISYDPKAKFNLSALSLPLSEQRPVSPITFRYNLEYESLDDVTLLVHAIVDKRLDLLDDYSTWFAVGSGFARELGENGRAQFHAISQFSPKYDYSRTDRDYSQWMKYSNNKGQLGAFFNVCKENDLRVKDLKAERYRHDSEKPFKLNRSSTTLTNPKTQNPSVTVPIIGYDYTVIEDLLKNPHHYTSHEAVSKIVTKVPEAAWRQALIDYLKALQHPDPEIAANAYLKVLARSRLPFDRLSSG